MKKSRLTETQIVSTLKQYDRGTSANDLCREHGISHATLYNGKNMNKKISTIAKAISTYELMAGTCTPVSISRIVLNKNNA